MPSLSLETTKPAAPGAPMIVPAIWEQRIGETKDHFERFMVFCREADPAESLTLYLSKAYPDEAVDMLEVALYNDWWPRRTAYVQAVKDIVLAQAQTLAFTGVARAVKTGLVALDKVREQLDEMHKRGEPTDSPAYVKVFKQFESITNLMTRAAKATTSIEVKQFNANISPAAGGQVAVFSKDWEG